MKSTSQFRLIAPAVLLVVFASAAKISAATITWNNLGGGDWGTDVNWSPQQVPGASDTAVINGAATYTIQVSGNQSVSGLALDNPNATLRIVGGGAGGSATLNVAGGFENRGIIEMDSEDGSWSWLNMGGVLTNAVGGVVRVRPGTVPYALYLYAALDNRGTFEVERTASLSPPSGQTHRNSGTVNVMAGAELAPGADWLQEPGGLVNLPAGAAFQSGTIWTHQGGSVSGAGTFKLSGTLNLATNLNLAGLAIEAFNLTVNGPGHWQFGAGPEMTLQGGTINTVVEMGRNMIVRGDVTANTPLDVPAGSRLRILGGGGGASATLNVANGFENRGIIEMDSEDASWSWLNMGGVLTNAVGGVLRVRQGTVPYPLYLYAALDNRGTFEVERTASLSPQSGQSHRNSGTVNVMAGAELQVGSVGFLNATNGWLIGHGSLAFSGSSFTNQGVVAPGVSPGILTVNGDYPQAESARLMIEIGGTGYDRLVVSGSADLDGTLHASLLNGFLPRKDDAFTVLTYTSRTGGFSNLVSAEPERIAWKVEYGPANAQLIVLNSAPTLAPIANQTVNEGTAFSLTVSATDQDLPADTLIYSLDTSPTGMTINPASGLIIWTPTELEGLSLRNVTVRVTDNGTPSLAHTTNFTVTVNEVNVAPQLVLPGAQTVDEQVELAFTINGTDADLPANTLTYELVSGPAGATFNAATRELRWTPTEGQGPGNFTATFRVTDNSPDAVNSQQLSDTRDVNIAVAEVNLRPTLANIDTQTANEGTLFSFTAPASDADLPGNMLTYSLDSAPAGMTINPTSGAISWTPSESQGSFTNTITVVVTDTNPPAVNAKQLSATNTFQIVVNELNVAPVLTLPPSVPINELVFYTNNATATDADSPANPLVFALVSGPSGLNVSSAGAITWTPTEAQGPGPYPIQIQVTDTNSPAVNATSLSVTNSFTLTVDEVNLAPTLLPPTNRTIHAGTTLSASASATDPDIPVNMFSYSKLSGPADVNVSAAGLITWTTSDTNANTTNVIVLQVTDDGVPALSDTKSFIVTVNPPPLFTSMTMTVSVATAVWTAIPGTTYRLQYKTNLNVSAWDNLIGDVTAIGATASKADATFGTNATRFYRVLVLP